MLVVTLDTAPPAGGAFVINDGAPRVAVQTVTLTIESSSLDVDEMIIWGDVDIADSAAVQATEGASQWITFAESKVIRLSSGDGPKTINLRLRDDVGNATLAIDRVITLDGTAPWVEIVSGVDVERVSTVAGHDEATFSWRCNQAFEHYEVKVVPSSLASYQIGTALDDTDGSLNIAGDGAFPATTPITTTINGADLQTASPGDGPKIIKVFVRNTTDVWSL